MPVKSEEHESFAAIVTVATVTGGNLRQKAQVLGPGKEYCFELREKPRKSIKLNSSSVSTTSLEA